MAEVVVRPMEEGDVAAAADSSWAPIREAVQRYHGEELPEQRSPESVARSEARVDHIRRHDPEGSWVAELDGRIVGTSLATKREGIWFLSLLAVSIDVQSMGIGKRLLDASLSYANDARGAWIMATLDPRATHRYGSAGFALKPAYEAHGKVDRSLLVAEPGVREGSFDDDAEWINALVRKLRGASFGPDLEATRSRGARLIVLEDRSERAYSFIGDKGVWNLGATSPRLAARILMASVAEGLEDDGEFTFGPLTGDQQWAIEVALALKLPLVPGASLCIRGEMGPLAPYIPNGAYG